MASGSAAVRPGPRGRPLRRSTPRQGARPGTVLCHACCTLIASGGAEDGSGGVAVGKGKVAAKIRCADAVSELCEQRLVLKWVYDAATARRPGRLGRRVSGLGFLPTPSQRSAPAAQTLVAACGAVVIRAQVTPHTLPSKWCPTQGDARGGCYAAVRPGRSRRPGGFETPRQGRAWWDVKEQEQAESEQLPPARSAKPGPGPPTLARQQTSGGSRSGLGRPTPLKPTRSH